LIIPGNVKLRNVLLDGDMETHNADFGVAKTIAFKPNDDYVNTTILVDGTYGYIAPNKHELRFG
jgi:serine/threonine protein kinase